MNSDGKGVNAVDIEQLKHELKLPLINDKQLIELALSDTTYLNHKNARNPDERDRLIRGHRRLAHLGDSIMNTAVVDYLFKTYPDIQVGVLHKMGESLKQCNAANAYARVLGLTQVGMCNIADGDDPASRERLYAELFEALIGALYLDWNCDFNLVRDWFQKVCGEEILNLSNQQDLAHGCQRGG